MANKCFNCDFFKNCKNTEGYYTPDRKDDCPHYQRSYLENFIAVIDKKAGIK